jgi:NAD(P)-dependent dehydrogenase (short-subunit alcohol dehydrogenase family)
MQDFVGKTAIVTGTTGIGKAIAKRLARGGARAELWHRRKGE